MNVSTGKRKRARAVAEINVVPYIDVMLVLLVIFMITAPLLSQGVKVNLPQAQSKPIANKDEQPIIISVDATGRYYVNIAANPEDPITTDALVNQISAQLHVDQQQGKTRMILIKGDKQANYGQIVQAMAALQSAGVENVGLMTESLPNLHQG